MKNKTIMLILLVVAVMLSACNNGVTTTTTTTGTNTTTKSTTAGTTTTAATTVKPTEKMEMATLVVSGLTGDASGYLLSHAKMFNDLYPDVKVEWVVTDTNTREQVLKTAISAGDPPAIGYYWGTRVNSFYDIGMNLDLRDYFDQSFFDPISKAMLEPCIGKNDEVFAIPFSTVYHTTFYNKEMLDEYDFSVPETWDDLTEIFARLKQDDIFGFATNSASMQDCLYGLAYAELESKVGPGTSYGIVHGDVSVAPGSPAGEVIREVIEQVKEWYDAGYWYPGVGGINTKADDANAAFSQGRSMFIFNFSGAFVTHEASCDFEIGTFMKPTSKVGMTSYENIEPSVYFIPSNCSEAQINSALEWIKIVISEEGQQAIVDSNNAPSIPGYSYKNISPILEQIMSNLATDSLIAGINPTGVSSQMQTFIKQQIFAAPLSGVMTIDETLEEMESIRLEAKNK